MARMSTGYIGRSSLRPLQVFSTAATLGTEVSLKGVEQAVTDTARALFSLLVAKCEGKAFGIVQLCPKGNGLEAWRRLKDEFEGRSGNRLAAMLRGH